MDSPVSVHRISECFIKPKHIPEATKRPFYLSRWDLVLAGRQYIKKGLLFAKPPSFDGEKQMKDLLQKLKDSLSLPLVHFWPLAGRLATLKQEDPPLYTIYVDCTDSPGATFIHAFLDLTIDDILSPTDVPEIVRSFFDHRKAINHDGHIQSLLSIQVTELKDAVFISSNMNHMLGDETSFWHFWNTWSEIFNANGENIPISRPPIHERWLLEGPDTILGFPFTHQHHQLIRHEPPLLRERVFHLSSESLAKLKAKANAECKTTRISTCQALCAHVWRCTTRSRNSKPDSETSFIMSVNNRTRVNPPVSENYVGSFSQAVITTANAGDLLENGLGWSAWKLHQGVKNHTDEIIRPYIDQWLKSCSEQRRISPNSGEVFMGSSPRFNMYGNEFGLGKALAVRISNDFSFDGKVSAHQGIEAGSMDLNISLQPYSMSLLESDSEFMETVFLPRNSVA